MLAVVLGVVVRRVDVDVEPLEEDLADAEALPAEPVAVPDLVRVPVHGELVEGGVVDLGPDSIDSFLA